MEDRIKIPNRIESTLMFQNDHTCCICREKGKDVQIHHIVNRNNNTPSNLAVLCLDCHSRVTGSRGLGKKFTEQEVKQYKKNWEFLVKRKRGLIIEPYKAIKKGELNLIHFEIKKSVFEYSATRNIVRAKEILDYLHEYFIFESSGDYIIEQMHHIIPDMLIHEKKGILVAKHIPTFFAHLVAYDKNEVPVRDIKIFDNAIDLMRYQGELQVQFGDNSNVLKATVQSLFSLFELTTYPELKKQQRKIISSLETMKRISKESYMPASSLKIAIKVIDHYLKKIKSNLNKT